MTTLTKTNNVLKNVGHKHEAIMQWMLENPEAKLADCALQFNVTQTWLSVMIHSDAFQDKFQEFRDEHYSGIAENLEGKLTGLAHLCVDRLAEKMETCDDMATIAATTDKVLGRLGLGASKSGNITVNASDGSTIEIAQATPAAIKAGEAARQRLQKVKDIQGEVISKGEDGA